MLRKTRTRGMQDASLRRSQASEPPGPFTGKPSGANPSPFCDRNMGVLRKAAPWTGIARGPLHPEVGMPRRPEPSARPQEPEPFIEPGVPQEPVEPIQGTAPLNPQPGRATRPRPPSPGRGSSAGSGKRGFTNSSPWGIVSWGPWVSPPWGMGFQLPSEATCVPLAYPKRDKRSGSTPT